MNGKRNYLEKTMKNPKFTLHRNDNDKFYFTMSASNGQTIIESKLYDDKASAMEGIEIVKKTRTIEEK